MVFPAVPHNRNRDGAGTSSRPVAAFAGSRRASIAYVFDAASGQLQTVASGEDSATYSYLANSPLVENITFQHDGTTRMTTSRQYDALNRLTSITNEPVGSSAIGYRYGYNAANQRIRRAESDASYWLYTYDQLGQVISGKKYWGDGTPVAGQQFEYAFDDIGNRRTNGFGGNEAGLGLRESRYAVNALNQYSSRTVPGFVNVLGEAAETASVSVNTNLANRKGRYFRAELSVDNAGNPVWLGITNVAVLAVGGGNSVVSNVTGGVFVAKTAEQFGYDADGNMTADGRWTFTWDAENRLVRVESRAETPQGSWRRVEWQYDALGRRVRQTTSDGSSGTWVVTEDLKFVSDPVLFGRHIAELNATNNTLVRSYVWGLDLSGSLDGAGGVGGLLWLNSAANGAHFCAYDGNGNVAALTAVSDGSETARYEYGPFGEPLRVTGPLAKENPFRFSTKRTDNTTDLVLYECRVYIASLGGWTSRDPIGEEGFYVLASAARLDFGPEDEKDKHNPYAFVQNHPLDAFDAFGLQPTASCNPLCGPDVTRPLQRLVLRVFNTWNTWTPAQQKAACKGLTSRDPDPTRGGGPAWLNAWDIDMLFNKGWINTAPYCPPCATPQAQCRNTVQVGNQCYYAGSANYVLFGHMANLCGWPKWKMTLLIWGYKGPKPPFSGGAPNYTTSRDWAIAGYDGWPAGSATPPPGDRPKCNPACPVAYSGPAFRFYWYPHGWN